MIVDRNIHYFLVLGENILKKKPLLILIAILLLIIINIFLLFFYRNPAKNSKIGNNSTSQEIVDYILNISSYETEIEVEVNSNKKQNKYTLKQQYQAEDTNSQEVVEPSNIAGVKIRKNGNKLTIENTDLNLSTIYENYAYISDNRLDLSCFIKNYKEDEKANWKEENNQIVMKTKQNQEEKSLWIDKTTAKPTKLEIKLNDKKSSIYILYKEVNLNN